jgi:hypothetical protein
MDENKIVKNNQSVTIRVVETPRRSGVPTRQQMYAFLKDRSLQLQGTGGELTENSQRSYLGREET